MEIGHVADTLERQQVGVDTCKAELRDLKTQFTQLREKLGYTDAHIRDLEKKLTQLDQQQLELNAKFEQAKEGQ
jgi:chromosome segregation ATPase